MPSAFQSRFLAPVLFLLLAGVVACLAINSQSLWIDEAQTALKAIPPTLHGLWQALDSEHNSNLQLPLYMLYIWGWARLFGVSEVALRAANIPWFFVGLLAILRCLRHRPGLRNATLLVYCLHPFVWYYLDEARPYLMQLSGALLVAGSVLTALDEEEQPLSASWWWHFGAGLAILCGAGLLGVPWAVALLLPLLCHPGFRKSMLRSGLPALVLFLPLLVLLALYFAWTIKENISAGYRPMNISSTASVFYDQLGFMGLGPGRATLRPVSLIDSNTDLSSLYPYLLPLSLLGLPLACGLLLAAFRRFGLSPARFIVALLLAAGPTALIFALGYVHHVRILGRHLTPLFPFILLAQACTLLLLWKSGCLLGRAAAALILVALTVSSLEIRFAPRHFKDDNRSAAAAANQSLAQGKTVWWAASQECAQYYHLPIDLTSDHPGMARYVTGVPASFTALPNQIFLSKPDLFDASGDLSAFVAAHHYHIEGSFQAFTVWGK